MKSKLDPVMAAMLVVGIVAGGAVFSVMSTLVVTFIYNVCDLPYFCTWPVIHGAGSYLLLASFTMFVVIVNLLWESRRVVATSPSSSKVLVRCCICLGLLLASVFYVWEPISGAVWLHGWSRLKYFAPLLMFNGISTIGVIAMLIRVRMISKARAKALSRQGR